MLKSRPVAAAAVDSTQPPAAPAASLPARHEAADLAAQDGTELKEDKPGFGKWLLGWAINTGFPAVIDFFAGAFHLICKLSAQISTNTVRQFVVVVDEDDGADGGKMEVFGQVVASGIDAKTGKTLVVVKWDVGGAFVDLPIHFVGDDIPAYVTDRHLVHQLQQLIAEDEPMIRHDGDWVDRATLIANGLALPFVSDTDGELDRLAIAEKA